ncbi:MAG: hypothetical protein HS105_08575 [Chloracidobacterium sp.]|nr:hypothetical protein [Chloracidobacterium sp.]
MKDVPFFSKRDKAILIALFIVGVVVAATLGSHFWQSYLVNALFVMTFALGAAVFIAVHYVSNSGWTSVLRRVPEALMSYVPVGALTLLVVFFGRHEIYKWTNERYIEHGPTYAFKDTWLTPGFFFARMFIYLLIWTVFVYIIRYMSTRQDGDGSPDHTASAKRYSALFLVIFGVTYSLASFDWIMSIEPLFYSTIFGFYLIAGTLLSGVSAITFFIIFLQRYGILKEIGGKHLHKLGVIVLGYATFWAYIWISQYLLIYYANLPEETIYYFRQTSGRGWFAFFIVNLFLNWIIPFIMLLPKRVKFNKTWLLTACTIVLVGRWLDMYVMVMPPFSATPAIGIADIALLIAFVALFLFMFVRNLSAKNLVPIRDPYLAESLWHEDLGPDWQEPAAERG